MDVFVGIDWGSRVHAVCVLDGSGRVLDESEVPHNGDAVLGFVEKIRKLAGGSLSGVRAAMETPHGTMVEALIDAGAQAYHLNPKQLDRFRDRRSVAGAKDDDLDALVLADSLRTDRQLFRVVPQLEADMQQLRATSRTYAILTQYSTALSNQVRENLQRYYPQMLQFGPIQRQPWLWELFRAAPTPEKVAGLRPSRVRSILSKGRIRRLDSDAVMKCLHATPVPVAAGVAEGSSETVLALLFVLETVYAQRQACISRLEELMQLAPMQGKKQGDEQREGTAKSLSHKAMLRDAALLQTLPGIGIRTGAVVLAEGHVALQARDYTAFRRLSGTAPVSRRTGGKARAPRVAMRRSRSGALSVAVYQWAEIAARYDDYCKAHYARLRARGHNHARAVRGVADRLSKVAIGVLKSGQPYDPKRRGAFPPAQESA